MPLPGVVFIVSVPTEIHENHLKTVENETAGKPIRTWSHVDLRKHQPNLDVEEKQRKFSRSETYIYDNEASVVDITIDDISYCQQESMEKILRDILEKYQVETYTMSRDDANRFIQLIFSLKTGELYESLLEQLHANNIGTSLHSTVSVMPCSLYYHQQTAAEEIDFKKNVDARSADKEQFSNKKYEKGTWGKFMQSVRARLTIAQVIESVKADALLTFDFVFLVVMSTLLCAIGLVENSNVFLLSSMLISPMMGPVMAGTFGTVIRDKELQKIGVQSELIGLGIATIVGFCYGSIICLCTDKYGENDWPTSEMISRGEIRTLGVGCLIALLSGAAVAVGVLSHNIASLVGVAISTSLMPPAVNAGLLWSMTFIYYFKAPTENARYVKLSYTDFYSEDRAIELTCLGAISLCLTFVNIICIYVSSILVFKLKEVAPIASKDQTRRQFWKHVKLARNYNRLHNEQETVEEILTNKIDEKALRNRKNVRFNDLLHHSTDLSHENVRINIGRCQYTWSPCSYTNRPSIQQLKDLYRDLMNKNKTEIINPMVIPEVIPEVAEINICKNKPIDILGIRKKFVVTPCSSDPLIQL